MQLDQQQAGLTPRPVIDQIPGQAAAPIRRPVRRGEPCPRCEHGILDYNGLLDLECPACGYSEGAGAGCT